MIPTKHSIELAETGRASQYESTKGKLSVTVIVPGLSKNKRYYSAAMLKKDFGIFKSAKMFADHQTESESHSKPEGSIKDWVGSLKNVWCEDNGTVKGEAIVVDAGFKRKLELLASNGLLGTMGISIRATGEAYDGEVEGNRCKIVESLLSCRSVDFVTFAAAGGQVDAIESVQPSTQDRIRAAFSHSGFLTPAEAVIAAESIMRESEAYSQNRDAQMFDAYQHTLRQRRFDGNIVNGLGTFKRGNIIVTIGRDGWKCGPDSGKDKATLESCLDLKYPVTPLPQESVQESLMRKESVEARLRRAFENILPPEEAALAARGPMQNGTEIDVQLRGAALNSRLENLDLLEPQH